MRNLLPLDQCVNKPGTVQGPWTGLVGTITFLVFLPLLPGIPLEYNKLALLLGAAMALSMLAVEVGIYGAHRRGLASETRNFDAARVARKLLALYTAWACVYLPYWSLTRDRDNSFVQVWELAVWIVPVMAVAAVPYFFWQDRRQQEPEDEYHHAGLFLTGRWSDVDWIAAGQFVRGWMVKGFFLPLMATFLIGNVRDLASSTVWSHPPSTLIPWVEFAISVGYCLDVAIGVIGYACAVRAIDTHIRSTEPTFMGWTACLMCYTPFSNVLMQRPLNYNDNYDWKHWLGDSPFIAGCWAAGILFLVVVYVWATVIFGLRFSNLTHRGIITNGPYRWVRHPAYLSKNLTWWMIAVPFISKEGSTQALINCGQLLCVNAIYALRAYTEEQHLARDPAYRAYRDWMRAHGLGARLERWLRRSRSGTSDLK